MLIGIMCSDQVGSTGIVTGRVGVRMTTATCMYLFVPATQALAAAGTDARRHWKEIKQLIAGMTWNICLTDLSIKRVFCLAHISVFCFAHRLRTANVRVCLSAYQTRHPSVQVHQTHVLSQLSERAFRIFMKSSTLSDSLALCLKQSKSCYSKDPSSEVSCNVAGDKEVPSFVRDPSTTRLVEAVVLSYRACASNKITVSRHIHGQD